LWDTFNYKFCFVGEAKETVMINRFLFVFMKKISLLEVKVYSLNNLCKLIIIHFQQLDFFYWFLFETYVIKTVSYSEYLIER
jgi:hypothetical protein